MLPPKPEDKKKGLDVMIAVGGKPGLGAPKPYERKDEPDEPATPDAMSADEQSDAPGEEQSEEGSSDILKDIEAVGSRYGADAETAHAFTADILEAVVKCLKRGYGGDQSEQQEPAA